MVMASAWRQPTRLLEDVCIGQQQLLQYSSGIGDSMGSQRLAAQADPAVSTPSVPKGHREGVEVPNNGPQRAQPLNTENQVKAAQVEGDTVDGEGFLVDENLRGKAHAGAADTITIRDQHGQSIT